MKKGTIFLGTLALISSLSIQSCTIEGCTDEKAVNYEATATDDDGSCEYIYGCTDSDAYNYDPNAGIDDGSCEYQGEAIFWTDADYGVGFISVYVEGTYEGQITDYHATSTPDCGASGCVTITREPGYYSFTATATGASWDWRVTIYENDCSAMRLYVSKDGVPKVAKEPHGSYNTFLPEPLKN